MDPVSASEDSGAGHSGATDSGAGDSGSLDSGVDVSGDRAVSGLSDEGGGLTGGGGDPGTS